MSDIQQRLADKFTALKMDHDFAQPLAAHAIGRIEALLNGRGVMKYKPASGDERKHPLQKIKADLERLQVSLAACYRAANAHDNVSEFNAYAHFLELSKLTLGDNPSQIARVLHASANSSLVMGLERPDHAPTKLFRDEFVRELYFLFRSHQCPVDWIILKKFVVACWDVLPADEQEDADRIIARVERLRQSAAGLKWENVGAEIDSDDTRQWKDPARRRAALAGVVSGWIDDRCDRKAGAWTRTLDLHRSFQQWSNALTPNGAGLLSSTDRQDFAEVLSIGFAREKRNRVDGFNGIKLLAK